MSYIPDYRCDKNYRLLTPEDQAFLRGYHFAMEDARSSIREALAEMRGRTYAEILDEFDVLIDLRERETTCSIFDTAIYIPEDADIVDVNKPMYTGTKGARGEEDCDDCGIQH